MQEPFPGCKRLHSSDLHKSEVFWVLVEEGSLPVHVLQAIKHIETVLAALGLWVFSYRRNMRLKHLR